jgi:hypothetical protein
MMNGELLSRADLETTVVSRPAGSDLRGVGPA